MNHLIASCVCTFLLAAGCAAAGSDASGENGDHGDFGANCSEGETKASWTLNKRLDKEWKTSATNPLDQTKPLASAYFRAGAQYEATASRVKGSADATAGVSLLGLQKELATAKLDGMIESGDKMSATADVMILDPNTGGLKNVFHTQVAAALGFASTWDRQFYETPEFEISIIPLLNIGIIGTAYGSVQLGIAGGPSIRGSELALATRFEPSVKVWGTARAGIGFLGLGAGVEGQLTLLDAQAPTAGNVSLVNGCLGWKLDSDIQFKGMSGDLQAYAKLGPVEKRRTLVSDPSGLTGKFPVVHEAGAVRLGN